MLNTEFLMKSNN